MPAKPPAPAFDATLARMYKRRGADTLPAHLEAAHGVAPGQVQQLDVGVFRVDRRPGTPVVARMFSARRAHEAVLGDLAVLEVLRAAEFPAAAHLAVRPGGATDRPAGALHHYAEGTPADDATGLPEAFVHPDPVPKNAVFTSGGPVLVDWAGAGRGPRLASLALVLRSS